MRFGVDFYKNGEAFLARVFAHLAKTRIELRNWDVDHLCYRTDSDKRYHEVKEELAALGALLIESEVNGRLIATYKLDRPFFFQGYMIDVVELPAPKPGKVTPEGFEHVEVVCDVSFEALKATLARCHLKESTPKKEFNYELEVCFDDCAVKFHQLSLESVVRLEGNARVWSAIKESAALSALAPYRPLIAGSFPLGVHVDKSDVDILVCSMDLGELEALCAERYGHEDGFKQYRTTKGGVDTLVTKFFVGDVPFEIFGQSVESIEQTAYRHFLVEERILKLGGSQFRQKVMSQRAMGAKTEPAFALALGLAGDPFAELLRLHQADMSELRSLLIAQGFQPRA